MRPEPPALRARRRATTGHRIRPVIVLTAAASGVLLLVACGPPPSMLDPLFPEAANSASGPKPYVGTPRRQFVKKQAEAPVLLAEAEPERPDLAAIYGTLPRNEDGQILWMKALAEKVIAPKPGIAEDAKEDEPTDMDIELVPKDQAEYKVVFSHKVHTTWMVCDTCHTGLFEMEKGKTVITMDKINAGESCGVCHGKVAAPEPAGCPTCHEAMGK